MKKKTIPESEMIINSDGTIFHLHIHPEQLSDRIMLLWKRELVFMSAVKIR